MSASDPGDGPDLVVVGVDGSTGSDHALRWALDFARRHGSRLRVVSATGHAPDDGALGETTVSRDARRSTETEQTEQLARWGVAHDPVIESTQVLHGAAADVLVSEARHAALLVVGSRGHGRLRDALVGSVAQGCIHRASCPVVVLPAHVPGAHAAPPP